MPNKTKDENIKDKKVNKKAEVKTSSSKKKTSSPASKAVKTVAKTKTTKTTKPATAKKSKTSTVKKTTKKPSTNSKSRAKKSIKKEEDKKYTVEYYDLPIKYNHTVVKTLAQSPNILFAYWELSDKDIENFIQFYGKNFFEETKPVLIVHNKTKAFSFEVEINDFANNWYISTEDANCEFVVELGRRVIKKDKDNLSIPPYVYIASSNSIKSPNDRVLFFGKNDKIRFLNVKTKKVHEIPIENINNIKDSLKQIYFKEYNLEYGSDIRFDFSNPSSSNPSSNFR